MRYASTILYVPDVAAAAAFYERAFGLQPGFADPGGSYAVLAGEDGGAVLAFAHPDNVPGIEGVRDAPAGFELWLETAEVEEAYARAVQAGAEGVQEATQKPWGQTVAYVRDLNGTLVELGEPVTG